jgi:hypothetical protein
MIPLAGEAAKLTGFRPHVRFGSFSTDLAGCACRPTSASRRKRPKCSIVAKRRDGPKGDISRDRPDLLFASLKLIAAEGLS